MAWSYYFLRIQKFNKRKPSAVVTPFQYKPQPKKSDRRVGLPSHRQRRSKVCLLQQFLPSAFFQQCQTISRYHLLVIFRTTSKCPLRTQVFSSHCCPFKDLGLFFLLLLFQRSQLHWSTLWGCHIGSQPNAANIQNNKPVHEQITPLGLP